MSCPASDAVSGTKMIEANLLAGQRTRHMHEILFAINVALASLTVIFTLAPNLMSPFFRMELTINRLLDIRQTDLIRIVLLLPLFTYTCPVVLEGSGTQ